MNLQGAMDSIEAGRQAVKKINHAGPAREYEAAVAHLNAALMSLMIKKNEETVSQVVQTSEDIVRESLEPLVTEENKPKRKRKKD